MASVRQTGGSARRTGPAKKPPLAEAIFEVTTARLSDRADDAALFTETGRDWQAWLTWEVLAACIGAGWAAEPHPPYDRVGVVGSRDHADLLVFDPATGSRVLVELSIVHDWSTNKWIADLNAATDRLRKASSVGVAGLQMIVAASLTSAIEVNATSRAWLGMSEIWPRATDLKRGIPMGQVGQLLVHAWTI